MQVARYNMKQLGSMAWDGSQQVKLTTFFRDGKRKIDAILIYDNTKKSEERDCFMKNLKKAGLELEEEVSTVTPSRTFVKVHGSEQLLQHNANLLGIPVKHDQLTVIAEDNVACRILQNILNNPNPDPEDPVAKRAWESVSKQKPTKLTNCERSAILFIIMDYINFSKDDDEFALGLKYLKIKGGFESAYPIHDGPWRWPKSFDEPINDRQLLSEYWANYNMFLKQQPLTNIEHYYGPEIAMYFSWLSFYNKMLCIAAIMGICTYMYGIIRLVVYGSRALDEVCESELYVCPPCKKCIPKKMKQYCNNFKFSEIHDHGSIVFFACAMAFWAQAFMEFWKRRENNLRLKWNLNSGSDDTLRPEFQATVKTVRKHEYTEEMEQYIPGHIKILKYSLSVAVVFIMLLTVLVTIFVIIIMECLLKVHGLNKMRISFISSFITLMVMMVLKRVYASIATRLTDAENPRTVDEYDKSCMIKMVVFSLVNSYGKLIYMAFFKGKFFTYPGDEKVRLSYFPISAEVCGPSGCVYDIAILLGTIIVIKPFFNNIYEVMYPVIQVWIRKIRNRGIDRIPINQLHIWEQDYHLIGDYSCSGEFEEMVMQYGFVTLLVAAFPLAPFFALINNIFEIRIDASNLVKCHRRPSNIYKKSVQIWTDTLQSLTYFAIFTNALYLSFTTNFITSVIYYIHYKSNFEGFYFFLLSKYKVEDNYWTHTNITECLYAGFRYGPDEDSRYKRTYLHYYILSCQLGFAMIFVVAILFITAILSYAIPDIPSGIQDLIAYNAKKERRMKYGA